MIEQLLGMSRHDKILVLMAWDVCWMPLMDARPGARFSRVGLSLKGRKGLLEYSEEELNHELMDYVLDLSKLGGTCDDLVAWAQESTGVQFIDLDSLEWRYRPDAIKFGYDHPYEPPPRGAHGLLLERLESIRDRSQEHDGVWFLNGKVSPKLLGR